MVCENCGRYSRFTLLNCDGVRLLREWFSDLGEVAVVVVLVTNLTGIVDEGEGSFFVVVHLPEAFNGRANHAAGFDGLEDVRVLFLDGIVPDAVSGLIRVRT